MPATPEILLLVTAAFGLLAVACTSPPWWPGRPPRPGCRCSPCSPCPPRWPTTCSPGGRWRRRRPASGCCCSSVRDGARRPSSPVARRWWPRLAVVIALGLGAVTGFVGTAGRFEGGGGGTGGGRSGSARSPRCAASSSESDPVELFRVRGLHQAQLPAGADAERLRARIGLAGHHTRTRHARCPAPIQAAFDIPGTSSTCRSRTSASATTGCRSTATRSPCRGLPDEQWIYDRGSGTAYTAAPARTTRAGGSRRCCPRPTADELRSRRGRAGVRAGVPRHRGRRPSGSQCSPSRSPRAPAPRSTARSPCRTSSPARQRVPLQPADRTRQRRRRAGRVPHRRAASATASSSPRRWPSCCGRWGCPPGWPSGSRRAPTSATTARSARPTRTRGWRPGSPASGWTTFDPTPLTDGRADHPALRAGGGRARHRAQQASPPPTTPSSPAAPPRPSRPRRPTPSSRFPPTSALRRTPGAASPLWPFAVGVGGARRGAGPGRACGSLAPAQAARGGGGGRPGRGRAGWAELLAESADRGIPVPATDTVAGRRPAAGARAPARRRRAGVAAHARRGGRGELVRRPATRAPGPAWPSRCAQVRAGIAAGTPLTLRQRVLPRSVLHRLGRPGGTAPGTDRRRGLTTRHRLRRTNRTEAVAVAWRRRRHGPGERARRTTPARTGGGSAPPSGR